MDLVKKEKKKTRLMTMTILTTILMKEKKMLMIASRIMSLVLSFSKEKLFSSIIHISYLFQI